ncbi:MAG: HD domain-containing protein [Deltaproteobacteria bacterium]|jgi:HD-GYP domain-containing protein (c-di-GMP phosphodiesterase class II)|nr:HD domain-containing protein [Deltaproteobacteria bacterium]MBT4266813.1 HD domain-containing protein [Deltaproteobacteria bacterium]MBT4639940.1 HD domain-containing protein [Deltaproteobacteria bacterium]MBT6611418.1 HD domain-containing protein [Deltaproteobacteria bacterium]MBT7155465.1 HD domain-containing protein [Deltaproteobacteria bacterium]
MAEETKFVRALVSIKELRKGMQITSYVGFNKKYESMNEETCTFTRHNFRNARARIIRGGKELDVQVNQIAVGDTLSRIYKLPPELKKLTNVNEKLAQALMQRGFLKFEVKKPVLSQEASSKPPLTKKQEEFKRSKVQANKFVQQVKENVVTHNKASQAVENIMDDARKGKVSYSGINEYVDTITTNSSAEAMSAILSLKESDQTYDHCIDVGTIFQTSYFKILKSKGRNSIFENESQALLGAFLHDFGKSKVPKDILDSTVRFERDSKEMQMMQSHPVFAVDLLAGMGMSDDIINMAHYHHVKQDTTINSCYPKNVTYDEVIYETRLIAIIDVYQALVGKRKYKKSWNPPAAMRYLDALAGVEFDMDVWDDFLQVMGLYPKGSLVELNDSSAAFVMSISEEDPEKPQIVVVRNAAGEDLTHHTLLDLQEEKEIEIVKDLDVMEVFGKDAMAIFSNINIT